MSNHTKPVDPSYMEMALGLAKKSNPSPNPRVGAVIVGDDGVVGLGHHESPGTPHAEINALAVAGNVAIGSDLYVTLEPCCHQGKTGPCVEAIVKSGISRVIVGMVDPDPRVMGKGISYLEGAGIEVEVGILKDQCEEILSGYIIQRTLGRPLFTLKAAITMDGMIASLNSDSKWISSEESRKMAHQMRGQADAVLVGVETVLKDNPELTVRHVEGESPLRIVVDSSLRTPPNSKLISSAAETPTLLAYSRASSEKIDEFNKFAGVKTLECAVTEDGRVDLQDMATKIGGLGILSVLVEGGGKIHGSFAKSGLADRIALFVAPKILGSGISWISFEGTKSIADGLSLQDIVTTSIGEDLLIQAKFTR